MKEKYLKPSEIQGSFGPPKPPPESDQAKVEKLRRQAREIVKAVLEAGREGFTWCLLATDVRAGSTHHKVPELKQQLEANGWVIRNLISRSGSMVRRERGDRKGTLRRTRDIWAQYVGSAKVERMRASKRRKENRIKMEVM